MRFSINNRFFLLYLQSTWPLAACVLLSCSGPLSAGTDALLRSWDGLEVYAFPPFALDHLVMLRLRQSLRISMTLVSLFWHQMIWFLEFLGLLVEVPVALPLRRVLLRQPHFPRLCQNLRTLLLNEWRLSGGLHVIMASLRR